MPSLLKASDREAITARLQRLTPVASRQWGRMTVHEAVCHMSDQLRVALGDLPTSSSPGLMARTLGKWLVLYLPIPTPRARIQTAPEMRATRPSEWARDLAACADLIQRVGAGQASGKHPAFGQMTPAEWRILTYKHLHHHLQQFGA